MLDLTTLDTSATSEAGVVMEVRHPTTDAVLKQPNGQPVTVTLAGEDSERYRRAWRESTDRKLKMQQRGRQVSISAESVEADAVEILVACTIGWSGIGMDGAPLEFSPDNARKIYARLRWLREQADSFISDRANFLRASPTN
jgi:hypothetical protein